MLFTITTNGVKTVVDAPNKAAANAYGAARVDMSVEQASLTDLQGTDVASVPVVLKGGKTQAELDKIASDAAAKKAAADAKKASAPAA